MNAFFSKWKGEFDNHSVYQLTWLRYHFKHDFIPLHYPIYRNTGIHVHDVLINKKNEHMIDSLTKINLPHELLNQLFLFLYDPPPYSIDIQYRHSLGVR